MMSPELPSVNFVNTGTGDACDRVRAMSRKFAIGFAVVLGLSAELFPAQANAEADNVKCQDEPEEGMIYIALGEMVFKWPRQDPIMIAEVTPEQRARLPIPPRPTDPVGCPGHPLQLAGFYGLYQYQAILENRQDPQIPSYVPEQLELVATTPDDQSTQDLGEGLLRVECGLAEAVKKRVDDFDACLIPQKQGAPETGVYVARSDIYVTPLGRPFVFHCSPVINTALCDVSYKFYPTLNVVYSFRPSRIPIVELIAFDRALRALIEGRRLPAFHWAK
jgi:hypothetical protein